MAVIALFFVTLIDKKLLNIFDLLRIVIGNKFIVRFFQANTHLKTPATAKVAKGA